MVGIWVMAGYLVDHPDDDGSDHDRIGHDGSFLD